MPTNLWELSPWAQLPYVSRIIERTVNTGVPPLTLTTPNNQRCGLLLASVATTTPLSISTLASIGSGAQIPIPTSVGYIFFSSIQHGILPQLGWYGISSANVQVIEMIAENWPQDGDHYLDAINHPAPPTTPTVLPTGEGVGGQRGVLSYWLSLMAKIKGG